MNNKDKIVISHKGIDELSLIVMNDETLYLKIKDEIKRIEAMTQFSRNHQLYLIFKSFTNIVTNEYIYTKEQLACGSYLIFSEMELSL